MKRQLFLVFLKLILLSSPFNLLAFQFFPSATSIDPTETNASSSFTIVNNEQRPRPIQVRIYPRKMDHHGQDILENEAQTQSIFVLYPNQFILEPQQQRQIKVFWKGERNLDREQNYRIVVEELPVDLSERKKDVGGNIKILLRYISSVYITPPGAEAKIKVQDGVLLLKEKKKYLSFTVMNTGTKHFLLENVDVEFTGKNAQGKEIEETVALEKLPPLVNQNLLAGGERTFEIPWPSTFDSQKNSKLAIRIHSRSSAAARP